ncbi:hypothetical protein pdam_00017825 [Pocillopora damicornis]|uniref:Uncharacterized protein n=1 Tax=Pocillopora damicornis TaxID=46731 RepID=A0A3M6TYY4_POCDA|nr:hypothetical protein pdam_00017825 [Pocillopora damicornis]
MADSSEPTEEELIFSIKEAPWELGKKGRSGNDMQGVAVAANGAPLTLLKQNFVFGLPKSCS